MEQVQNYGDTRQTALCVYCGGKPDTRDHIPPKVLLDEPYPTNLPVIPACFKCNNGISADEEYLACIIEFARTAGDTQGVAFRKKITRILENRPALAAMLDQSVRACKDGVSVEVDSQRVEKVVLKLARGHAAFDLNEPQYDNPTTLSFVPIATLDHIVSKAFENPPKALIWPEVGSRAMQRMVVRDDIMPDWIVVQPGRYRYLTSVGEGALVRIVVGEYLACEVIWESM